MTSPPRFPGKFTKFQEISGCLVYGAWQAKRCKKHFISQSNSFATGSKFGLQSNSDRPEGGSIWWSGMTCFLIFWVVTKLPSLYHQLHTLPIPVQRILWSYPKLWCLLWSCWWMLTAVNVRVRWVSSGELVCGWVGVCCVCVCASVFSNVQKGKLHTWRHLPAVSKGCLTIFDLSSGAEVIDKALEVSKRWWMLSVSWLLLVFQYSV